MAKVATGKLQGTSLRYRPLSFDPIFDADPIGSRLECRPKKGIIIFLLSKILYPDGGISCENSVEKRSWASFGSLDPLLGPRHWRQDAPGTPWSGTGGAESLNMMPGWPQDVPEVPPRQTRKNLRGHNFAPKSHSDALLYYFRVKAQNSYFCNTRGPLHVFEFHKNPQKRFKI